MRLRSMCCAPVAGKGRAARVRGHGRVGEPGKRPAEEQPLSYNVGAMYLKSSSPKVLGGALTALLAAMSADARRPLCVCPVNSNLRSGSLLLG